MLKSSVIIEKKFKSDKFKIKKIKIKIEFSKNNNNLKIKKLKNTSQLLCNHDNYVNY